MDYYRLVDDVYFPNRWYLRAINSNNWKFTLGQEVQKEKALNIEILKEGVEMDFTLNEAYSVPIVSERFKNALSDLDELQFLPISINNMSTQNTYYVMVITALVDGVDESNSSFEKFQVNDPVRPDLAGEYSGFLKLVVDESKVAGNNIFRLDKFNFGIIVSDLIKNKISNMNGVKFISVSNK